MSNKKILVLAGSFKGYLEWCRCYPEYRQRSKYVNRMEHVFGYANCEYVICGRGCWKNPLCADSEFCNYISRHNIKYNKDLSNPKLPL